MRLHRHLPLLLLLHSPVSSGAGCVQRSAELLDLLTHRDYIGASRYIDPKMRGALSASKLEIAFSTAAKQYGPLQGHDVLRPEHAERSDESTVSSVLRFKHGTLTAVVSCDANGDIAGIHLRAP
jgi:hypothetical protein